MTLKIILFSDLHLHAYREFSHVLPNGRNSRLQASLNVLTEIRNYALENRIKHILFGGDLFDRKNHIPVTTYQPVYLELVKMFEHDLNLVFVPGNHDQVDTTGKVHALKAFNQIAIVADKPRCVELEPGYVVQCVPWMDDQRAFAKALAKKEGANLLLAHGAIAGATTGPVEYQPESALTISDISPERFDFCFFGHFHKRQQMEENCWYIGSPLQQWRGERNDVNKGFLVYDTKAKTFNSVELHMPEFVTHSLGAKPMGLTGSYVDVEVEAGTDVEAAREKLASLGAAELNFVPVTAPVKEAPLRIEVNPGMSRPELLEKYARKYAEKGDCARLIALAMKYLGESR